MKIILEYANLNLIKDLYSVEDENFAEEKYSNILIKSCSIVFDNCIYSDKDKEEIKEKIEEQNKNNEKILEELCKKMGKTEELNNIKDEIERQIKEEEEKRIKKVKEYYKKHKKQN